MREIALASIELSRKRRLRASICSAHCGSRTKDLITEIPEKLSWIWATTSARRLRTERQIFRTRET